MTEREFPVPAISIETEAYWAGANDGKLLMKRCTDCNKTHFYPRAICPYCQSANTEWYEASGKGVIYSYSVMRRGDNPYAIAYVTVDEGVTMLSNIVEYCPPKRRWKKAHALAATERPGLYRKCKKKNNMKEQSFSLSRNGTCVRSGTSVNPE